jgi:hypothetical protein
MEAAMRFNPRIKGMGSAFDWVDQLTAEAAERAGAPSTTPTRRQPTNVPEEFDAFAAPRPFLRVDNPWMWMALAGALAALGTLGYLVWRAK